MKPLLPSLALAALLGAGCASAPVAKAPTPPQPVPAPATNEPAPTSTILYLTHHEDPDSGYSYDVPQGSFMWALNPDIPPRIQNFMPSDEHTPLGLGQYSLHVAAPREGNRSIRSVKDCDTHRPGHFVSYPQGYAGWVGLGLESNEGETYLLCLVSKNDTITLAVGSAPGDGPAIANAIFRSFKLPGMTQGNPNAIVTALDEKSNVAGLPALSADDTAWIAKNAAAGTLPQETTWQPEWKRPEAIRREQVRYAYRLTDTTAFALVQRPNMNIPLLDPAGKSPTPDTIHFSGLLFTSDNGQTWKRAVTLPTVVEQNALVSVNPVELSWDRNTYVLSVADTLGAGSGEGNVIRYASTNGKAWKRKDCRSGTIDMTSDPQSLKPATCPAYLTDLERTMKAFVPTN